MRARSPALVVLVAALIAGCGGDDGPTGTTTTTTESAERAKLPQAWTRQLNSDAGISVGVPPLWRAQNRGSTIVVRSPDKLLAILVSADRTSEAIDLAADEFARGVASALPGYESFAAEPPKPFEHRYTAAAVAGSGEPTEGPAQEVLIVVLAREGVAKVTALAAWNEAKTPPRDVRQARRILRTIRTQPVA